MASVSGSPGTAYGVPTACWWPPASVTEITANRGSTASSNVSVTRGGEAGTVALATGVVRSSTAWADATAGNSPGRGEHHGDHCEPHPSVHVSERLPENSAIAPSKTPIAPSTMAMIGRVLEVLPSDETPLIVGLGVSDVSSPVHSTTVPSE